MKLIDKDTLVERIKKLQKRDSSTRVRTIFDDGRLSGYSEVLRIIESMEVKDV